MTWGAVVYGAVVATMVTASIKEGVDELATERDLGSSALRREAVIRLVIALMELTPVYRGALSGDLRFFHLWFLTDGLVNMLKAWRRERARPVAVVAEVLKS